MSSLYKSEMTHFFCRGLSVETNHQAWLTSRDYWSTVKNINMSSSTVTFVTALLGSPGTIQHRKYFELFRPLAESGINLVVFMSEHLMPVATSEYPNVEFEPVVLEELKAYQTAMTENAQLPQHHDAKDTKLYMAIINSKNDLVLKAMSLNRPKTTHYGWIDFGIIHITSTPRETLAILKAQCERLKSPLMAIPGIWGRGQGHLTAAVVWRFCGGLFVGDMKSVKRFCLLARDAFALCVKQTGIVAWEVNTWARLELEYGWNPDWFFADHDISMLRIPDRYLNFV